MSRTSPPDRLEKISDAALRAFSREGFCHTQVADIASLAGVSPGTLYLYATGKRALFWMALQRAMGLPTTQAPDEEADIAQALLASAGPFQVLPRVVAVSYLADGRAAPLELVFGELFDSIEYAGPAIRLVERCAEDWPELAEAFFGDLRPRLLRFLTSYLDRAVDEGIARPVPDSAIAARIVVETIAWFTMHRHRDYDGAAMDRHQVRTSTLDALTHAFSASNESL